MGKGPRFSGRQSKGPVKAFDAESVAAHLFKTAIKISDKENGDGADWPMLAEAGLIFAFLALDKAPHDPRTLALLRRIENGTYTRIAAGPGGAPAPSLPSASLPVSAGLPRPPSAPRPK